MAAGPDPDHPIDTEGMPLSRWLETRRFTPAEVLRILIQAAEALDRIHATGLVHRDVTPATLRWAPDPGLLELIDSGLSVPLHSDAASSPPCPLEGALEYLAPEQTGRLNRGVDGRADLYGLGATAWHLLVGHPPFVSSDPVELIHAHLARPPAPPRLFRPEIPPALDAILLKMLAKQPEDRYQSAGGLIVDLKRLEAEIDRGGSTPFPLGTRDLSHRLKLPEKRYGGEREQAILLEALTAARQGAVVPVLIAGPPGIGKSTLAAALQRQVTAGGGHFASGRFEPLRRDIPYQALTGALRGLLRQILSEGDAELEAWKDRLTDALGAGSYLLRTLLPELDPLLGAPPPGPDLSPAEARVRMRIVFSDLLRGLARRDRPLALFLDDLQWADNATLELIDYIGADPGIEGMLLVCAFRDDEPSPMLEKVVTALEHRSPVRGRLRPAPLDRAGATALIAEGCVCTPEEAGLLASVLLEKTAGNPFFVRSLLTRLREEGLLWPEGAGWRWDLEAVRRMPVSENVAGLMLEALKRLPAECRAMLEVAASQGPRFSVQVVAAACGMSAGVVVQALLPALEQGLIAHAPAVQPAAPLQVPPPAEGAGGSLGGSGGHAGEAPLEYRFAHDRVQETAYGLLEESRRPAVHRAIGRALLAPLSRPEQSDTLYEIVDHLFQGRSGLEPVERVRTAWLALAAGRKARAAAAFESALTWLEMGLELLGDHPWTAHRALALALSTGAAEAAFVTGDRALMDRRIDAVIAHAPDLTTEVPAWVTRLQARMADDRLLEAVELSDAFLTRAGRPQPRGGSLWKFLLSLIYTVWMIGRRKPEALIELPEAKDPLLIGIQHIQVLVAPAQLMVDPGVIPRAVLRDVRSALRDGVTASGAQCWTGYALLQAGLFGRVAAANRYGDLGLALADRLRGAEFRPRIAFFVYTAIRPWTTPFHALIEPLRENYRRGLEVGDLNFALLSAHFADLYAFHAGVPLEELRPALMRTTEAIARHHHPVLEGFQRPLRELVAILQDGTTPRPAPLSVCSSDEMDPWARMTAGLVAIHRALIFGEMREALAFAREDHAPLESPARAGTVLPFWTYAAVAMLYGVEQGWIERREIRARVRTAVRRLRAYARHAPFHRYRLAWIDAADLAAGGKIAAALERYDVALYQAGSAGAVHDAALMADQAARLCEAKGRGTLAAAYRSHAQTCYRQWGALARVAQLEALDRPTRGRAGHGSVRGRQGSTGAGSYPPPHPGGLEAAPLDDRIDLRAVMKASQALSEEIVYPRLLSRILVTLLESSGATGGALVLLGPEGATIEARVRRGGEELEVDHRTPLEGSSTLPEALVRYVMRTGQPVVLEDAAHHGEYTVDPWVRSHGARSLLCAPLLRGGQVRGAVYLENDLTTGCFTAARLETVRLLASQAVISLENATLYDRLEARVRQRTRELEVAREKAEVASRAKGEFLAHMSHELRTPLNAILGFTQVLSREHGRDAGLREGLTTIDRSGRHLLALIDDVLDMARIEAGRLEITPASSDLAPLLRGLADLMGVAAEGRGIRLEVQLRADVPTRVRVDERRLRQVLLNLVGNAIKFTARGEVRLSVGRVDGTGVDRTGVDVHTGRARIRFEVRDTGVGIPPERLEAIFQPFEQAGAAELRARGTGLGLSISQRLVGLMGGRIEVESELGKGSRFWFDLEMPVEETRSGAMNAVEIEPDGMAPPQVDAGRPLELPPREELEALRTLALQGNLVRLAERVKALEAADDRYAPFAQSLLKLADEFDDQAIQALLRAYLGTDG